MRLFRRKAKVQQASDVIYQSPELFTYRGDVEKFTRATSRDWPNQTVDARQDIQHALDVLVDGNIFGANVNVYCTFTDGAVDHAETGEQTRTLVIHVSADPRPT